MKKIFTALILMVLINGNLLSEELNSELNFKYVNNILEVPDWNFDGSSTNQAEGRDSEIILKPKSLFKMPFYLSDNLRQNYLVMCDTYKHGETGLIPCETNNRHLANEKFLQAICEEPWYGLEQEYFIIDSITLDYDNN